MIAPKPKRRRGYLYTIEAAVAAILLFVILAFTIRQKLQFPIIEDRPEPQLLLDILLELDETGALDYQGPIAEYFAGKGSQLKAQSQLYKLIRSRLPHTMGFNITIEDICSEMDPTLWPSEGVEHPPPLSAGTPRPQNTPTATIVYIKTLVSAEREHTHDHIIHAIRITLTAWYYTGGSL